MASFAQVMYGTLGDDYDALVSDLGARHKSKYALRRLMAAGPACTPALRRGLAHDNDRIRVGCCKVLDHYMDDAAIPELKANLDHPNPDVRAWAIHALACDRCKEGTCRPGEDDIIPLAIAMLEHDTDQHVRQMAVGMLGPSVHRNPLVLPAIERCARNDDHPAVRKIARWHLPGGPRYEKLLQS